MALNIKKGTEMMQIPVIPLVDTVFNLLIFFLVATKLADAENELNVALPSASEAKPMVHPPQRMVINIDAAGRFFIAAESVTLDELDRALRRAYTDNREQAAVVIRADKRCRSEFLVAVMNACTKAKLHNVLVTARDPREGAG